MKAKIQHPKIQEEVVEKHLQDWVIPITTQLVIEDAMFHYDISIRSHCMLSGSYTKAEWEQMQSWINKREICKRLMKRLKQKAREDRKNRFKNAVNKIELRRT